MVPSQILIPLDVEACPWPAACPSRLCETHLNRKLLKRNRSMPRSLRRVNARPDRRHGFSA